MKYAMILALITLSSCSADADENIESKAITVEQIIVSIDNVDASEAPNFISDYPEAIVLDVRTPAEFDEAHIAKAINVDYRAEDFREQLEKLDKNSHYILHCKSGSRSGKSLEIMKELGFSRITHMDGGFDAWKAAGNPTAS